MLLCVCVCFSVVLSVFVYFVCLGVLFFDCALVCLSMLVVFMLCAGVLVRAAVARRARAVGSRHDVLESWKGPI